MPSGVLSNRSVGIRTRGLLDPNQARYQASPHPDSLTIIVEKETIVKHFYFLPGGGGNVLRRRQFKT